MSTHPSLRSIALLGAERPRIRSPDGGRGTLPGASVGGTIPPSVNNERQSAHAENKSSSRLALQARFNLDEPAGTYELDLSHPFDRWVASELQKASVSRGEAWLQATLEETSEGGGDTGGDTGGEGGRKGGEGRRRPMNATDDLPERGTLRLEYPLARRDGVGDSHSDHGRFLVHYMLDLGHVAHREVAVELWQRARAEPMDLSWAKATLDGLPFEAEEADELWALPAAGMLEVDCYSRGISYEISYDLHLERDEAKAFIKVIMEKVAADDDGEIVDPMINGEPLSSLDASLDASSSFAGRSVPPLAATLEGTGPISQREGGRLSFRYVCRHPLHISTRHYVLDLSRPDDGALAAALYSWSAQVPGESILLPLIDGEPFAPPVYKSHPSRHLPKEGILEFDYVVLYPHSPPPKPPPPKPPPPKLLPPKPLPPSATVMDDASPVAHPATDHPATDHPSPDYATDHATDHAITDSLALADPGSEDTAPVVAAKTEAKTEAHARAIASEAEGGLAEGSGLMYDGLMYDEKVYDGLVYARSEEQRLQASQLDLVVASRLEQLAYEYPGDPWLAATLPRPTPPPADGDGEDYREEADLSDGGPSAEPSQPGSKGT